MTTQERIESKAKELHSKYWGWNLGWDSFSEMDKARWISLSRHVIKCEILVRINELQRENYSDHLDRIYQLNEQLNELRANSMREGKDEKN